MGPLYPNDGYLDHIAREERQIRAAERAQGDRIGEIRKNPPAYVIARTNEGDWQMIWVDDQSGMFRGSYRLKITDPKGDCALSIDHNGPSTHIEGGTDNGAFGFSLRGRDFSDSYRGTSFRLGDRRESGKPTAGFRRRVAKVIDSLPQNFEVVGEWVKE